MPQIEEPLVEREMPDQRTGLTCLGTTEANTYMCQADSKDFHHHHHHHHLLLHHHYYRLREVWYCASRLSRPRAKRILLYVVWGPSLHLQSSHYGPWRGGASALWVCVYFVRRELLFQDSREVTLGTQQSAVYFYLTLFESGSQIWRRSNPSAMVHGAMVTERSNPACNRSLFENRSVWSIYTTLSPPECAKWRDFFCDCDGDLFDPCDFCLRWKIAGDCDYFCDFRGENVPTAVWLAMGTFATENWQWFKRAYLEPKHRNKHDPWWLPQQPWPTRPHEYSRIASTLQNRVKKAHKVRNRRREGQGHVCTPQCGWCVFAVFLWRETSSGFWFPETPKTLQPELQVIGSYWSMS